jgi:hypothetical protein
MEKMKAKHENLGAKKLRFKRRKQKIFTQFRTEMKALEKKLTP